MDALIAAGAIANGHPLYTCEPDDFAVIDGLTMRVIPTPTGSADALARPPAAAPGRPPYDSGRDERAGMSVRTGSRGWVAAFAAGLLLRPLLIVPMAPRGPLAASDLLPVAIVLLFAGSAGLAAGAWLGSRLFTALGILSAVVAPAIAAVGAWAGLPAPWPLLLAIYDVGLAVLGVMAWRARWARDAARAGGP